MALMEFRKVILIAQKINISRYQSIGSNYIEFFLKCSCNVDILEHHVMCYYCYCCTITRCSILSCWGHISKPLSFHKAFLTSDLHSQMLILPKHSLLVLGFLFFLPLKFSLKSLCLTFCSSTYRYNKADVTSSNPEKRFKWVSPLILH